MKTTTIERVKVQGCCGGVRRAIDLAMEAARTHEGQPITVLGDLVHNRHVIEELAAAGIRTVEAKGRLRADLLDEIDSGIVIFTAHGVSDRVRQKAAARNLTVVDASCPFVMKTQKKVREMRQAGYAVFYIGQPAHPEAESITDGADNVYLIHKEEDIPEAVHEPVFVTNQTTMSTLDIQNLFNAIKKKYPAALFDDEICNATRVRQQAILDLKDTDALIVVGDPLSNNTRQLEAIGKKAGIPYACRVESATELANVDLPDSGHIAVTSGASTPGWLVDEVIDWLRTKYEAA